MSELAQLDHISTNDLRTIVLFLVDGGTDDQLEYNAAINAMRDKRDRVRDILSEYPKQQES